MGVEYRVHGAWITGPTLRKLRTMTAAMETKGTALALTAGALEILRVAKRDCPGPGNTIAKEGDRQPTGNLRRSLNAGGNGIQEPTTGTPFEPAKRTAGGATIEIGSNVEYAGYVHNGTSKMPPRPFLLNAVEKSAFQANAAMAKVIELLAAKAS